MCVVAGPPAAVAALAETLAGVGVFSRRVQTGHALHSAHMAGAAAALAQLVSGLPRQAPAIPFLSNVTGTWITAAEATSPAYWARQLCEPVRFAEGLATRRDGNNVELDRELLHMSRASSDFSAAQTALSAKFRLVRYAISESK